MEVVWTCLSDAYIINHKNCATMDTTRKRNRGRPKETWRRTIEKELKSQNLTLQTAPQAAADRDAERTY